MSPVECGGNPLVVGTDRLIPMSPPGKNGGPLYRLLPDGQSASVYLLNYSAESGFGPILREH